MNSPIRLEDLIATIVKDRHLHARWLNTLSLLEYIGFRKIVKSQRAETLNAGILAHAAEESGHAVRLKKLAMHVGGPDFDSYAPEHLLCGEAAQDYFQSLDHQVEAQFGERSDGERTKLTYLYVSWLIERRALAVYGVFKKTLAGSEIAKKLDGLLNEEVGHLRAAEAEIATHDLEHSVRAPQLVDLEAGLYETFIGALATALQMEGTNA